MSKEYFYESDDGFVKLSWEDVLAYCPGAVAVTIDEDGKIRAHRKQPDIDEENQAYYSLSPSIFLVELAMAQPNWKDLVFYSPAENLRRENIRLKKIVDLIHLKLIGIDVSDDAKNILADVVKLIEEV